MLSRGIKSCVNQISVYKCYQIKILKYIMDSKLTVKVFSVKIISRCCLHQKRDLNCEMTHDIILEML